MREAGEGGRAGESERRRVATGAREKPQLGQEREANLVRSWLDSSFLGCDSLDLLRGRAYHHDGLIHEGVDAVRDEPSSCN